MNYASFINNTNYLLINSSVTSFECNLIIDKLETKSTRKIIFYECRMQPLTIQEIHFELVIKKTGCKGSEAMVCIAQLDC